MSIVYNKYREYGICQNKLMQPQFLFPNWLSVIYKWSRAVRRREKYDVSIWYCEDEFFITGQSFHLKLIFWFRKHCKIFFSASRLVLYPTFIQSFKKFKNYHKWPHKFWKTFFLFLLGFNINTLNSRPNN